MYHQIFRKDLIKHFNFLFEKNQRKFFNNNSCDDLLQSMQSIVKTMKNQLSTMKNLRKKNLRKRQDTLPR